MRRRERGGCSVRCAVAPLQPARPKWVMRKQWRLALVAVFGAKGWFRRVTRPPVAVGSCGLWSVCRPAQWSAEKALCLKAR